MKQISKNFLYSSSATTSHNNGCADLITFPSITQIYSTCECNATNWHQKCCCVLSAGLAALCNEVCWCRMRPQSPLEIWLKDGRTSRWNVSAVAYLITSPVGLTLICLIRAHNHSIRLALANCSNWSSRSNVVADCEFESNVRKGKMYKNGQFRMKTRTN